MSENYYFKKVNGNKHHNFLKLFSNKNLSIIDISIEEYDFQLNGKSAC